MTTRKIELTEAIASILLGKVQSALDDFEDREDDGNSEADLLDLEDQLENGDVLEVEGTVLKAARDFAEQYYDDCVSNFEYAKKNTPNDVPVRRMYVKEAKELLDSLS